MLACKRVDLLPPLFARNDLHLRCARAVDLFGSQTALVTVACSKTMCSCEVSVKMQPLLVCPAASWRAMVFLSGFEVDRL